jgi:hypothetical protein
MHSIGRLERFLPIPRRLPKESQTESRSLPHAGEDVRAPQGHYPRDAWKFFD